MHKRTKACLTLVIGLVGLSMLERWSMPEGGISDSGRGMYQHLVSYGPPNPCAGGDRCGESADLAERHAQERTLVHLQFAFR